MDNEELRPGGRLLDSVSRRLSRARGRLSRKRAATAIGVCEATLLRIEEGRTEPTVTQLRLASECYGVPFHWLLFGEGAPDPVLAHLGADVAALLRQFMRDRFGTAQADHLSPAQLREVEAQADRLQALVRELGALGAPRDGATEAEG